LTEETKKEGITFELKNPMLLVFLAFTIVILILELLLILNRPIAFGDGAFHAYISKFIGTNSIFPKILPELNTYYTYSPLLHLLLSVFYLVPFGEVLAKAFIPFLVFITGLAVFVTVSKIFSKRTALIAAILIITVPVFVTYSVLIYTDILMILFFSLAVISILVADKHASKKYWLLAVIFACMSFLSKGIGVIAFAFIGSVLLYKLIKKEFVIKQFLKIAGIISFIAFVILCGWFVRNIIFYKTLDCNLPLPLKTNCLKETVSSDVVKKFAGYVVPSGSNLGVLNFGMKNFLMFMYGNLWLVPLATIIGIIFALSRREKIDYLNLILIFLVVLPALIISYVGFKAKVEQRSEDVARYLILSAFALPLISAFFIDNLLELIKKYWKFFPLTIIGMIIILSWINFKGKLDVMSSVTQFSPAFFQACDFIKTNTEKDARFLSLWAAPTAYNCERTAMWDSNYLPDIVLSENLTAVLNGLKAQNISYVFIQKFAMSQTPYQATIPMTFVQFLDNNSQYFKNIYENGPKLQDCIAQGGCDGTIVYRINYAM